MFKRTVEAQWILARNVWRCRETQRMSAQALAEKLKWSVVAVEEIERAEHHDVTLQDVDRLAAALSVDPSDLLRRTAHH